MNKLICVFDFETTGKKAEFVEPVEIACKFYDYVTLEPLPNGEYSQICKPSDAVWEKREQEAMDVHKIPVADIEAAPSVKAVWPQFVEFVNSFNPKRKAWDAPLAAGYNIRGYDLIITGRMNEAYSKKKGDTLLFSDYRNIDLLDIIIGWFDGSDELKRFKFDDVRDYFGIPKEGVHRALVDVKQEGALLMRMLRFQRNLMKNHKAKLKGSFKGFPF